LIELLSGPATARKDKSKKKKVVQEMTGSQKEEVIKTLKRINSTDLKIHHDEYESIRNSINGSEGWDDKEFQSLCNSFFNDSRSYLDKKVNDKEQYRGEKAKFRTKPKSPSRMRWNRLSPYTDDDEKRGLDESSVWAVYDENWVASNGLKGITNMERYSEALRTIKDLEDTLDALIQDELESEGKANLFDKLV